MARQSRGRRPDYEWVGNSSTLMLTANSQGQADMSGPIPRASTLMRCRGEVLAVIDGPTTNDVAVAACGLIVVTEEQLAVGTTAVPNPDTDFDAEWIWHGFLPMSHIGGGVEKEQVARITLDSKAMRRMKETQSVLFVATNGAVTGTGAIDVTFGVRLLFAR